MRKCALAVVIVAGLAALLAPAAVGKGPPPAGSKVLVSGAPIHGANGIMFDGEDRLHIASCLGREIVVMDPKSGRILDRLGPDLGVEGPDDLAFGPDGSVYWTSILTGEVGRLSPEGIKSGQLLTPGVNPITFSDDGRLFVGQCFLGHALYELDPELADPPRLIADNFTCLNGMDWGPDDRLYSAMFFDQQVVSIDVDSCTGASDPWTECDIQIAADGFGIPAAAKFDSQGRLHAVDALSGEIFRVNAQTGVKEAIAHLTARMLDNLAFDSRDRLFVSNAHDGSIHQVLPSGEMRMVSKGGMILPGGVAVLARPRGGDSVFMADFWSLREFNGLTGRPESIEGHFFDPAGLTSPFTVSPDGENLVLSSWLANQVQVWNPETREVLENHLDFAVPLNAIRFQGDLVVAELGTNSVVRASAEGRVTLAEGLGVPAGLAAGDDDLWVSDWATGSVLQIVADGEQLEEPIPVATGLAFPEGLALAADGTLLVVENGGGRLARIDTTTGEVSTVAEGLELGAEAVPGYPPTWMFNGVAVGPSGGIYVTGDVGNVLYRLEWPAALPEAGVGPPAGGTLSTWLGVGGLALVAVALGTGVPWASSRTR